MLTREHVLEAVALMHGPGDADDAARIAAEAYDLPPDESAALRALLLDVFTGTPTLVPGTDAYIVRSCGP